MREHQDEIEDLGARIVAIGTGDVEYGRAFQADERITFTVLVDDHGEAAALASVKRVRPWKLFDPRSFGGALRAWRGGHRIHKSGSRVTQLGATFVMGPGPRVRYAHLDRDTADHAPIGLVLDALRAAQPA